MALRFGKKYGRMPDGSDYKPEAVEEEKKAAEEKKAEKQALRQMLDRVVADLPGSCGT